MQVYTLQDIINKLLEEYSIENNKKNSDKLRKKFTRTFQELNIWDNAQQISINGNRNSKVFNENDIEKLKFSTEKYLIKLSAKFSNTVEKAELKKYSFDYAYETTDKNGNTIVDYGFPVDLPDEEIKELTAFKERLAREEEEKKLVEIIEKDDIFNVMIQALFQDKFSINYKLWASDKLYMKDFHDKINSFSELKETGQLNELNRLLKETHEEEHSPKFVLVQERLNNPLQAYVIPKKSKSSNVFPSEFTVKVKKKK